MQVRYLKQNARKSSKVSNITSEARQTLKVLDCSLLNEYSSICEEWLSADYKLYDHFKSKFHLAVER